MNAQFKKGVLELIVLAAVEQKDMYGYELVAEVSKVVNVKEGTIYPILYRLQEAELIKCRLAPAVANGGSKKYYSLTDKGRNILDELILFWSSYENCVNGFIESYQQARVSK